MSKNSKNPFTEMFTKAFRDLGIVQKEIPKVNESYVRAILNQFWVPDDDDYIRFLANQLSQLAAKMHVEESKRPKIPTPDEWITAAHDQPADRRPVTKRFCTWWGHVPEEAGVSNRGVQSPGRGEGHESIPSTDPVKIPREFRFGDFSLDYVVIEGTGRINDVYLPKNIITHYSPMPPDTPPEIQELRDLIEQQETSKKKRGEKSCWNGRMFALLRFLTDRTPNEEQLTLELWLGETDYYTFLCAFRLMDQLCLRTDSDAMTSLRARYLQNPDYGHPVPFLSSSLGVTMTMITEDGYLLITRRGTASYGYHNVFDASVVGGAKPPEDLDEQGNPDLYRAVIRESFEELGLVISRKAITFLSFGVKTKDYQYGLLGMVRLKGKFEDVTDAVQLARDRFEFGELAPFSINDPEAIFEFVYGNNPPSWSPNGLVCIVQTLIHELGGDRVSKAIEWAEERAKSSLLPPLSGVDAKHVPKPDWIKQNLKKAYTVRDTSGELISVEVQDAPKPGREKKSTRLDLGERHVEDKLSKWTTDFASYWLPINRSHIEAFISQFPRSMRWLGEALIDAVDYYDQQFFVKSLTSVLSCFDLSVRTDLCFCLLGSGRKSSSYISYILDRDLKIQYRELHAALSDDKYKSIVFVDDCLLTGTQVVHILSFYLGLPVGRRTPRYIDPLSPNLIPALRTRNLIFVAAIGTSMSYLRLKRFLQDQDISHEIRFAEMIPLLSPKGVDDFQNGRLLDENRIIRNPLEQLAEPLFTPSSLLHRADALEEAKAFCEEVGYALLEQRAASDNWTDQRRRGSSLGYSGMQGRLVFAHNVPKPTLTLLWSEGMYRGKRWLPLFRARD